MKFELNKVYRSRDGEQWKVVCVEPVNGKLLVVNKIQDSSNWLTSEGKYRNLYDFESGYDLLEFVRDDFTEDKPLRSFKFEGYLNERQDMGPQVYDSVQQTLGYFATIFFTDLIYLRKNGPYKNSKWEVTMKELPMEPIK
jgi:hypothetical protein